MFDPLDHLGPKRRKLLEQSWSFLFRREILSNLPVDQILPYYASDNGAPTKELYSMLGLMLLQQSFDLTDKEAIKQFAFNFEWHYALGIKDESDKSTYVSEKTLWNTRYLLTETICISRYSIFPPGSLPISAGSILPGNDWIRCIFFPTCATSAGSVYLSGPSRNFCNTSSVITPELPDSAGSRKA